MQTRRQFIRNSGTLALAAYFPVGIKAAPKNIGVQLYSVRKEMLADASGTLKQLAKTGYKELESARSNKGNYYGLKPKEIRKIARVGDIKTSFFSRYSFSRCNTKTYLN